MAGQFSEQGCLVSGAGAYFQNAVSRIDFRRLQHSGDHVGLRSGLLLGNRYGMVGIGFRPIARRDKLVARHSVHGGQHALIMDAALAKLLLHHGEPLGKERLLRKTAHDHLLRWR